MHRLERLLPSSPVNRVVALLAIVLLTLVGGGMVLLLNYPFAQPVESAQLRSWAWVVGGACVAILAFTLVFIRAVLARWAGALERERTSARRALDQQKFALDQHAIVSVMDGRGTILYANDRLCDISGFSRDQLLGHNRREFRSDAHPLAYYEHIWKTVSDGQVWHGELCNRTRSGEQYWVNATVVPILADDGHSTVYISLSTDITARKKAEQERQAANDVLSIRTKQLQVTLDNISQGVALVDANNAVIFQSRRVMELLEIPEHLLTAGVEAVVAYQTQRGDFGDDFALVEESARAYLRAGGKNGIAPPQRYTRRTLSGRTLEIKSATLSDGGFVRTYTDVTSYVQALANAEQASAAKGQFLANMSHEIRTPMNAILGLLQLLKNTDLAEDQQDFVHKTQGAARSLLGLLNDILDFSKVEAGKLTLDPRTFNLDHMLGDVGVILQSNVGNKPLVLRSDVEPDVPRGLLGDDMRLKQVLINLGGNAIKFTNQGEVLLRVRLVERSALDVVLEFAVCDSGIGIAPEHQGHIFNGFSQAEASTTRRYGGTGLGLSISSRLVSLLGGVLQLKSVVGQGSTFHFQIRFPLAELPTASHPTPNDAAAAKTNKPQRLKGMRILVVEDNKINQMVAAGLLRAEGAHVSLADNGQLGVTAVATAQSSFDVVLMDVQMPVMDGYAATRAIRQDLGLTALPIVAMTANAMASDRAACLAAGMNDHVGKPFEIDHLVARLQSLVGTRVA